MAITIKAELPGAMELAKELNAVVTKQMPFARVLAATRTAALVKKAEYEVMQQRFDRPTPFTMRSLMMRSANKQRPEARVFFKDFASKGTPADKYLRPQAYGGQRPHKRFERALIARGMMKSTQYAIPGTGAEFDAYGNMKRGQIAKILSSLQPNPTPSVRSKRKALKSGYFVGQPKGEPSGVWQRKETGFGQAIKPVMIFTDSAPKYRVRMPFQKIAANVVKANYERVFIDAIKQAVSTAR